MSEPEYVTIRCRTCGGVAHPASGCVYSPTFIICGPCTREAWRWIMGFINGKGARKGVRFYDHVNQINGTLFERTRDMSSNESQASPQSFHVEIRRLENGHVEKRMGPMSKDRAEKVARGAGINMSDYHAVVVGPDDAEAT